MRETFWNETAAAMQIPPSPMGEGVAEGAG
jgi:hypothetical protein